MWNKWWLTERYTESIKSSNASNVIDFHNTFLQLIYKHSYTTAAYNIGAFYISYR